MMGMNTEVQNENNCDAPSTTNHLSGAALRLFTISVSEKGRKLTGSRLRSQIFAFRSLRAFPITETELRLIAALANIGLRRMPNQGYRNPAATGTPAKL
jgi:hypothetical protein